MVIKAIAVFLFISTLVTVAELVTDTQRLKRHYECISFLFLKIAVESDYDAIVTATVFNSITYCYSGITTPI